MSLNNRIGHFWGSRMKEGRKQKSSRWDHLSHLKLAECLGGLILCLVARLTTLTSESKCWTSAPWYNLQDNVNSLPTRFESLRPLERPTTLWNINQNTLRHLSIKSTQSKILIKFCVVDSNEHFISSLNCRVRKSEFKRDKVNYL